MHHGFGHVFVIDIADVTRLGYTIDQMVKYLDDKNSHEPLCFGLGANAHMFFPHGTFPIVIGIGDGSDQPSFITFTIHHVLDDKLLAHTNAGIRAECSAYLTRSMAHGLEKYWATPRNSTSVKRFLEMWNAVQFKDSDDDLSGFNT